MAEADGSGQAAAPQPKAIEPEWRSRPYAQWSSLRVWQSYEGELWARRRVELAAGKPARLPEQLPRGARDGPLDHWRRGLVGAVQDWVTGSKEDAVTLLLNLIKRLDLQVCGLTSRCVTLRPPLP